MRLYVVVEGRRTEPALYRAWLPVLFPGLTEAVTVEAMEERQFFLVAGNGYPSYDARIRDAVVDIEAVPGRFDLLMICVDSEEWPVDERREALEDALGGTCPVPTLFVVADPCVETWLLGNREFVLARDPGPALAVWLAHWNVRDQDPEAMPARAPANRALTAFEYLRAVIQARGLTYSKTRLGPVRDPSYLRAIIARTDRTSHLRSFRAALESWRELGAVL